MDKNKKTPEDDLEEKNVIIGAEEADDEIEDDDLEEDDSYEEEAEEEEEEEPSKNSKNSKPQKSKPSKPSKPQKEPKKKAKKKQEEYEDEEEYEDDDEYDDDYDNDDGGGKTKIIIIAVVIAAAVAAAGIFMYNKITKDNEAEQQRQEQMEQQQVENTQKEIQAENEAEAKKNAEENPDTEEEEEATPTPTEEPAATSTPKPLPTATPTATPFPEETTDDDVYHTPDDDNDGVVDVSNEGTTGGISNDNTESTQPAVTQAPAGVIFVGDSRFRAMANIATDNSDLWECSSTGDYNWLTGTAFTDVDPRVGKGTKVFISIGINDLTQYQSYASAIVAKAQEWNAKGATVYFVSVGPVGSDSYILNQDIVNYNTYLYQSFANAGVYYIDAYNYLVQAGYDTTDGENYTDATSMALYNYINSLIGR